MRSAAHKTFSPYAGRKLRYAPRTIAAARAVLLALATAMGPAAVCFAQEEANLPLTPAPAAAANPSGNASTTLDIAPAMPSKTQEAGVGSAGEADKDASKAEAADSREIEEYRSAQEPPPEFLFEESHSSAIGFELREDRRKLNTGEVAQGLLIVSVAAGSPAAAAGLHSEGYAVHAVLDGVAVAAGFFFPPALIAVPIIDQVHTGDSYDMIIGVDGCRVRNLFDFEDLTRDLRPGDIVYLSVVRNGRRMQVAVPLTSMTASAS